MAGSTPVPLSKNSAEAFITYYDQMQNTVKDFRTTLRSKFEKADKLYQREMDKTKENTRAKAANDLGDSDRFQNVTVPVVMPQIEAAVAYQTSVFLTGSPIFGTVAAPIFMDEAIQMETIIEEQATKGGWTRELMMFFRDGFKYHFAPLEVTWAQEVTNTVETDIRENMEGGVPKEILWSGNKIKRLDPYNTFLDPRVPPTECYKRGEFAGYTQRMVRIELKQFIEELPDKIVANIKDALSSSSGDPTHQDTGSRGFFLPTVNPTINQVEQDLTGLNWMSWAGLSSINKGNIDYKESYDVTTLYCRVLPSEFELRVPKRNVPQIYKLIIVNHQHIIYCEKQTNAHNWLPILVGQPLEDGLGYQTKSVADNAKPFQQVASAYMNSILHSRRRAVTDRVLYDPSRISSAHINSDNPSAKIPVKPAAYGKPLGEAAYQFPYREDQASFSMQQIQQLLGLANHLSGQNQAQQGQFVKGNKTLHEFESVMQNANNRDQMASILLEAQVFMPMKQIIKLNILQYQGGTELYNKDKQVLVEIDPVKLRKAILDFKISDGLIPSSKLINGDSFATAIQVIGSSPQIGSGYNLAPMFSYLMKTQGADLGDFEKSQEQVVYEQALASWQQTVLEAIKQGASQENLPPQPKPQDYNYNPAGPAPAGETDIPTGG